MTIVEYLDATRLVRLAEARLERLEKGDGMSDRVAAVHEIIAEAKQNLRELIDSATPDERREVSRALADFKLSVSRWH